MASINNSSSNAHEQADAAMGLTSMAEFFHAARAVRTQFEDGRYIVTSDPTDATEAIAKGGSAIQDICCGLSAVGSLLAAVDHRGAGIDNQELGFLITNLSDLAFAMSETLCHINEARQGTH